MIRTIHLNFPVIEKDWLNYHSVCEGHGVDPSMFILCSVLDLLDEVGKCGLLDDPYTRNVVKEQVQSLQEVMDCECSKHAFAPFPCSAKPGGGGADERGHAARRRARRRRR